MAYLKSFKPLTSEEAFEAIAIELEDSSGRKWQTWEVEQFVNLVARNSWARKIVTEEVRKRQI
jgi:hypothetical protein